MCWSGKWALHLFCVAFTLWAGAEYSEVSIAVGQSGDGPKNHHGVKNVTAVDILFRFYPLIDENQRGFTDGANSGQYHHGLWILVVFKDSRRAGSLGSPAPVVLLRVMFGGE